MKRQKRSSIQVLTLGLFGSLVLGQLAACSKVDFVSIPPDSCVAMNTAHGASSCTPGASGTENYDYVMATGNVDILFINDNSGSMYVEQAKMANQFPGFLESIHRLSYQIGITSTDVAGGSIGKDGRFFQFPSGKTVLKNTSRTKDSTHYSNITEFQNTIKRSETLDCPNGPNCPSGDERGIYAAVRAFQRVENTDFFRPSGHLAVVILSDEDERSSGGGAPGSSINGGAISPNYRYETEDLPETLVKIAKSKLSPTKSMSVHSIIIRPGDSSCHSAQNAQSDVKGYYGTQYALLSNPSSELLNYGILKPGTLGSICSSNYTVEMGEIAQYLTTSKVQLPCEPIDGTFSLSYPDGASGSQSHSIDSSNQVTFTPALPAGTRVHFQFTCQ